MDNAKSVTAWTRAAAWTASLVIGTSLYFVFCAIFRAAPAKKRVNVQQQIGALMAETRRSPKALLQENAKHTLAKGRATRSLLGALQEQEVELMRKQKNARVWALLIAFAASGGCFMLCTAGWWVPLVRQKLSHDALAHGS